MSAVETSFESITDIDDLLCEILVRVPIHYLFPCQLVSKRWQSLISSPCFRRLRLLRPAPPSFILSTYFHKLFYLSSDWKLLLRFNFSFTPRKIIGFCNGLVLLECKKLIDGETISNYTVYNPTTGKSRTLPPFSSSGHSAPIFSMYLAYEPSKSPNYQVVRLTLDGYLQIYESETRNWAAIDTKFDFCSYNEVYYNGALHGIRSQSDSSAEVAYLDLKTHIIGVLPRVICKGYVIGTRLFESNGHLYCVLNYRDKGFIIVFELLEDHSDWIQRCRIDLSNDLDLWVVDNECEVLTILGGATKEESVILIDASETLIAYPFSGDELEIVFDWRQWNKTHQADKEESEDEQHLFHDCTFTKQVWARLKHWLHLQGSDQINFIRSKKKADKFYWLEAWKFMESYDPV